VVNLPWLWLNEAAMIVAARLSMAQSQNYDEAASALANARREIVNWAHRGALEVQGKHWTQLETEHEDPAYFDDKDWVSLKPGVWEAERLAHYTEPGTVATSSLSEHQEDGESTKAAEINLESLWEIPAQFPMPALPYVVINWERNSLEFHHTDEAHGYFDLRVRTYVIDQIIAPSTHVVTGNTDTGKQTTSTPPPKNPGGAPRKFADDLLIEIIRIANHPDGLPENKGDLVRQLRAYNNHTWGDEIPSESTIQRIVKMVYERIFQKP